MPSGWERAYQIAFVVGVGVLGGAVLSNRVEAARNAPALLSGDSLPAVPSLNWQDARATMVFVLRTTCEHCRSFTPFLREMVQADRSSGGVRFVAVFPEHDDAVQTYLRAEGLAQLPVVADTALRRVLSLRWRVAGYPTAILVAESGRVLHAWHGLQTAAGRAHMGELVRAVAGAANPPTVGQRAQRYAPATEVPSFSAF